MNCSTKGQFPSYIPTGKLTQDLLTQVHHTTQLGVNIRAEDHSTSTHSKVTLNKQLFQGKKGWKNVNKNVTITLLFYYTSSYQTIYKKKYLQDKSWQINRDLEFIYFSVVPGPDPVHYAMRLDILFTPIHTATEMLWKLYQLWLDNSEIQRKYFVTLKLCKEYSISFKKLYLLEGLSLETFGDI